MALSVTISNDGFGFDGNLNTVRGTLAFDSSYPTGGESLTPAMIGLKTIDHIEILPKAGAVFEYDYANQLVLAYVQGVQTAAAASATIDDHLLEGLGANTAVSIGLASGVTGVNHFGTLKEVADTTDLSTVTGVRFFARGA